MKKTLLSMLALAGALTMNAQNPFAYGLTGEFTAADNAASLKVNYALNTAADAVTLQVLKDGEVVAEETGLGATKGTHTATIDLTTLLSGAEYYGNYTWQIAVKGGATSGDDGADLVEFASWKFYHPCGLDIDNSFESASFGTLLVAEGKHPSGLKDSNYTGGVGTDYVSYPNYNGNVANAGGLYMFTPTLESIKGKDGYARFFDTDFTWSDQFNGSSQADFSRVAIADDGRVFVTRCNDAGDYILSAPSVADLVENGDFTSLVAGKTMTDTYIYTDNNGDFLLGSVQGFDVKGGGEDTKLLTITRTTNSKDITLSFNRVAEYALGNKNELPTPTYTFTGIDKKTYSYDRSADLRYDNRGGVWYSQYQSAAASINLAYVNANGEVKYSSKENTHRRGALSVSVDGTQLALGSGTSGGKFSIYDVTFDESGVPTLSEVYTKSPGGGNLYALAWDAAGNVYAGNAGSEYVKGFAVPRANNEFATKAASKYAFVIDAATAIDAIEVENAPVEYYNLQGVKVENPSNGIFIKKQGAKATKVVL